MLPWMLYVIMVTLLLSVGGYVAERALRLNRCGTRWIWLAAIAASLCMPFAADSVQSWLPNVVSPQIAREGIERPEVAERVERRIASGQSRLDVGQVGAAIGPASAVREFGVAG